jgi:Kdo2-lipid IVA lauroyltransferase/acyltransferase
MSEKFKPPCKPLLLSVFHAAARVFAFTLQYIFMYRKTVIEKNITLAFPLLKGSAQASVIKSFYRRFCYTIMEVFWIYFTRKRDIDAVCIADYSLLESYNKKGKNCIIWLGHQFNWEIANAHISATVSFRTIVVYRKLSSRYFNNLLLKLRAKYGTLMIEDKQLGRFLASNNTEKFNLIFLGDQNPPFPKNAVWIDFFGTRTPFPRGMANIAVKYNFPVLIGRINSGYTNTYRVGLQLLIEEPATVDPAFLLQAYAYWLEEFISLNPSNYLWSHNRWKHSPPD